MSASRTAGNASLSYVYFLTVLQTGKGYAWEKGKQAVKAWDNILVSGSWIQWWVLVTGFNHNNISFLAVTFGYRRIQVSLKYLMFLCVPFLSCSSLWEVHSMLPRCTNVLSNLASLCLWSLLDLPCAVTCDYTRATVLKPLTFLYLNSQYNKIQHPQVSSAPNSAFPPHKPDLTNHSSSGSQIGKFCLKTKGVGFRFLEIFAMFLLLAFWVRLH